MAFKDFQTVDLKTDAKGHAKFEIQLPDYFVGQPLQKGDALVKVEVKITDSADHTETITRTYPVSDQAVRVSLLPEGGRITPNLENRVFAAATYPDGSPAVCDVKLWIGNEAKDKPFARLKTNEAGLAEFKITPKPEQFHAGAAGQHDVEMLGGQQVQVWGQQNLFDLTAEAADAKGATAKTTVSLNSEPLGENVLLRLDKAVYKPGEAVKVDVRSSAGLPTVYLDVVRSGQTVLTQWLDVKDGRAEYNLDLPQSLFGTLEIHAYQMLAGGEVIRDGRVVYVQPANDLKIDVKADRDVYLPGAEGKITFRVTDADGKPAAAALGVLVVDEAVYALQEMQPGLEKVYFTLQEELIRPQAQVLYKPSETVETLVRQPALTDGQQQIAEALLTSIKPKPPARWDVNPVVERRQKLQGQLQQIGWALYNHAQTKPFLVQDKDTKAWSFKPDLLKELVEAKQLDPAVLTDPVGGKLTLETLPKMEKDFSPERLGERGDAGPPLAAALVGGQLHQPEPGEIPQGRQMDLARNGAGRRGQGSGSRRHVAERRLGQSAEAGQAGQEALRPARSDAVRAVRHRIGRAGRQGRHRRRREAFDGAGQPVALRPGVVGGRRRGGDRPLRGSGRAPRGSVGHAPRCAVRAG